VRGKKRRMSLRRRRAGRLPMAGPSLARRNGKRPSKARNTRDAVCAARQMAVRHGIPPSRAKRVRGARIALDSRLSLPY